MAPSAPDPGPIRYHALRLALRAITGGYVGTRVTGAANLPPVCPYII